MSSRRPIKAFYVSKRNNSQNSTRELISPQSIAVQKIPSFTNIDEFYPPIERIPTITSLIHREDSLDLRSKISSRQSILSKTGSTDKQSSNKSKRKKWLPIIIALLIALALIGVVILLSVNLSKKLTTTTTTTSTTTTSTSATSNVQQCKKKNVDSFF